MQQIEEQEKQMEKQTLLRVIKHRPTTITTAGDQEKHIRGYDEDWDGGDQ